MFDGLLAHTEDTHGERALRGRSRLHRRCNQFRNEISFKHKYWRTFRTLLSNSTCCEVEVSDGRFLDRTRSINAHIVLLTDLPDQLRRRPILIKIWSSPIARGATVSDLKSVSTSLHHLIQHYAARRSPRVLLTLDRVPLIQLRLYSALFIRWFNAAGRKSGQDIVRINTTAKNLTTRGETGFNEAGSLSDCLICGRGWEIQSPGV